MEFMKKHTIRCLYNKIKITENNYIDGTLIINKSGIEGIGYGCGESFLEKSLIFLKRILY